MTYKYFVLFIIFELYVILMFNFFTIENDKFIDVLALQKCNHTSNYTIHGLWKENKQFCKNDSFNVDLIEPLIPVLNTIWYTCYDSNLGKYYYSNVDFWKHEYNKHGSCFKHLNEYQYFNKTIELYNKLSRSDCDPEKLECLIPTTSIRNI